jgi:hypothetical protein
VPKDILDDDPSADELAGRAQIEQRVLRAQEARAAQEAQEAQEEREAELSRLDDDGSPVRELLR